MLDARDLFDPQFYLARNPDIALSIPPVPDGAFLHFTQVGQFQGRDPSPLFDTDYYLANNPDVVAAVNRGITTPFRHYIEFGQFESRNPSPLYDDRFYLAANPDVASSRFRDKLTGIQHFERFGEYENRLGSLFFDPNYYFSRNPDVAAAAQQDTLTGIAHYIQVGARENREFTPFIEPGGSTMPNGVTAGDITTSSAVLLARTIQPGTLTVEYTPNPSFTGVIGRFSTPAKSPDLPVKVELKDLLPNTQYFYRVTDAAGTTLGGQFRTSAPLGVRQGLRFGVASDWQAEVAPYPAISNMPERNLNFLVELGNTISADTLSGDLPQIFQAANLEQFRTKHNEVYSQQLGRNSWATVRATTPIYATWNDHELTDNFAGAAAPPVSPQKLGVFGNGSGLVNDTPAFEAAVQAFQEFQPLRDEFYGDVPDLRTANERKLYRYNTFGSDAAMFVLDVRSFRDAPLPPIPEAPDAATLNPFVAASFNPDRTLLGNTQLQQLKTDLLKANNDGITWKFVMTPVPMQNLIGIADANDRWEGYAAERTDLLRFMNQNNIKNVVFVSGGVHGTVVNDIMYQDGFGLPQVPTDAFDITVGTVANQIPIQQGTSTTFVPGTLSTELTGPLPQDQRDQYELLRTRRQKDEFIQNLLDARRVPLGYDPIGLDDSAIDATLAQGNYVSTQTFGWTEFEIVPETQQLVVTTYGIPPYTQSDLANPISVLNQGPAIVSQFVVNPKAAN